MKISYKENYEKLVVPFFQKNQGKKGKLAVPRIVKVVINSGIGKLVTAEGSKSEEIEKNISEKLAEITGQTPKKCAAKNSIASFKIREGMIIGFSVTLRDKRMVDFIDKFVNIVLPRTRDFWGISKKHFDKRGNLTIGLKDINAFPEVSGETIKIPFGIEVTFVTNTKNQEEAIKLFELLGFPLAK